MYQYKIVVHITYYNPDNNIAKLNKLKKVCLNYLKLSKKIKIFVHTTRNSKDLNNNKIKFIYHSLKNEHPYKLSWKYRKLMFLQKNKFDIFIYGEDDIIFSKKNLNYWLKYKDLCIRNNYNLGFLRVEKNKKNKKLYSSDQITKIKSYVKMRNIFFGKVENPYCALWIYDKVEFNKFVKTKYWKFKFELKTISGVKLIREMSAFGWHSNIMNHYKATLIPFKNRSLFANSFIKHISNNYVPNSMSKNSSGKFGTLSVNKIFENNLKYFFPKNSLHKFYDKVVYYIYYFLRFNLKNFKKKLN